MVVDVWLVPAGVRPTPEHRAALDEVERDRAATLPDPAAERFVLGRALLRAAVAARWACAPGEVVLRATCPVCGGAHGPVAVVGSGPRGQRPPRVSLTRAGPVVAVAVCDAGPVGIDAEWCAAVGAAPLADVALSPAERAALPPRGGRRRRALARAWVRKEATLKALGTGLTVAPAGVDLHPPARGVRGVDAVAAGAAVADLRLGHGRVGAVAVVAPDLGRLVVRRYDGVRLLTG